MNEAVEVVVVKETGYHQQVKEKMHEIKNICSFLGCISLMFGVIYTFCLYHNPSGITYPLFVAAAYTIGIVVLNRVKIRIKSQSWFLVAVSVLLALSTCRTGDMFIIQINRVAIFLLASIFMIHQFYDDKLWGIGKYIHSMGVLLITALTLIFYPFQHVLHFCKGLRSGRYHYLALVGFGVGCSLPVIMILVFLLSEADAIFYEIVRYVMDSFFSPWTLISISFKTLFGSIAFYCLICGAYLRNLEEKLEEKRKQEPLIAISGLTAIAFIYLIFCFIQVMYLFLGAGKLPEGMSYSSYARQGFFQLVFVVCINLVMVLLSLKYFKKNGFLNVILSIISGCTFIMIASAVYRMLLYVGEYHLTYLRLLVLWFLAMITVLMVGVIILIYNNKFPLFRFSLITVSVCYLMLAWTKPDAVIAKYNIAHLGEGEEGFRYLTDQLSVDALPVIVTLGDKIGNNWKYVYYRDKIAPYTDDMGVRSYNFAYAKASELMKEK